MSLTSSLITLPQFVNLACWMIVHCSPGGGQFSSRVYSDTLRAVFFSPTDRLSDFFFVGKMDVIYVDLSTWWQNYNRVHVLVCSRKSKHAAAPYHLPRTYKLPKRTDEILLCKNIYYVIYYCWLYTFHAAFTHLFCSHRPSCTLCRSCRYSWISERLVRQPWYMEQRSENHTVEWTSELVDTEPSCLQLWK